jgi:hypothetical protein
LPEFDLAEECSVHLRGGGDNAQWQSTNLSKSPQPLTERIPIQDALFGLCLTRHD